MSIFTGFPDDEMQSIVATAEDVERSLPGRSFTFYRVRKGGEVRVDIRSVRKCDKVQVFFRLPIKTALAPSVDSIAFVAREIKRIEKEVE